MKALILAGGLGTRLRPEVSDIPKPLADVAGRPFLEWQLDFLKAYDVTDVVLSVGHKGELISEEFGDGTGYGVNIEYVVEDEPLGTGGAIQKAQDLLITEENFLVLNGDTYLDVDLRELISYHQSKPATATLALSELTQRQRAGFVELDGDGQIVEFNEEVRDSGLVNGGIRVFTPELFSYMPSETKFDLGSVSRTIAQAGEMYGYVTDGYFKDMGTPERYQEINEEIEEVVDDLQ